MRYRTSTLGLLLLLTLVLLSSGCGTSAGRKCDEYCHPNNAIDPGRAMDPQRTAYLASYKVEYDIDWACRNKWMSADPYQRSIDQCSPKQGAEPDKNFIGLALSGGGSRAAVFSAAVMFELQDKGILQQVDVISSASGGSVTAALYATTCDPEQPCPATVSGDKPGKKQRPPKNGKWEKGETLALLSSNLRSEYLDDLLWTDVNIVRYYTTSFDRSDIMAQTMTRIFYGRKGEDPKDGLQFMDINPQRPYLIINATNNTESIYDKNCKKSLADDKCNEVCNPSDDPLNRRWFSYTQEHFAKIGSDLNVFPIAYAVAASAALPGVLHQATLRNFNQEEKGEEKYRHIHLLDAGVADNLSIGPLRYIIDKNNEYPPSKAPHKLIILVDAHTLSKGASVSNHDPRTSVVDYWFYDVKGSKDYIDVQYDVARVMRVKELEYFQEKNKEVKVIHIKFEDLIKEIDREKIETCRRQIYMCREKSETSSEEIERCAEQIKLLCDQKELEPWKLYELVKRIDTDWRLTFKDVDDIGYKYSWEKAVDEKKPCKKCESLTLLDVWSNTSSDQVVCAKPDDQQRCVALGALMEAAIFLVGRAVEDLRKDAHWKSVFKLE
jgi:predicted acylesterase/phospholipase RssA